MRIVAGIEIDPSTGPGAEAVIGEAWVRPAGLLSILETQLGLLAPRASQAERAAWLYGRLGDTEGFWSASLQADPWGTAARLVRDRDALAIHGWRGEPVSSRWDALWSATEGMPAGAPDRWAAVGCALQTRAVEIEAIQLLDPQVEWPGTIRQVFAALRDVGVSVVEAVPGPAQAFRPQADGSLQLVRPQAAMQAAEDVAAYLAALRDESPDASIVVVSPDATLDAALRVHGLPTTGGVPATMGACDPALQVLPLSLELVWDPPDPQRVLELLCLPRTPVPRRLAARLAGALRDWPAVGSDRWNQTLEEHAFGEDAEAAERRRERTLALLTPVVQRSAETIPTDAVRERVEVVAAWARALAQSQRVEDAARWRVAGLQHRSLVRLLDRLGAPSVSPSLLARLVDAATQEAAGGATFEAQAGLSRVRTPGAVIRPADVILWWNFTRDAAPPIRSLGLSRAEQAKLAEVGIELPSAGDQATWAARRWRRPLSMARQQLLLVVPQTSAPGEALHPHPLWDEVVASIPEENREAMAASLQVPRPGFGHHPAAPRSAVRPFGLPRYREQWDVPAGALGLRAQVSPSSLGKLIGCSFLWALHYPLRIRDDRTSYRLEVGPREYGSLAHEILATTLRDPQIAEDRDPQRAQAKAGEVFDAIGPRRIAHLFMPGLDDEREDVRLKIVRSASGVVQWLAAHDLRPLKLEESLIRDFDDRQIKGEVDLLAGDDDGRAVVVDYKWGGRAKRRKEIEQGTAYQLASYAYAAADGPTLPEYAYFILYDQRMLGREGGPFDPNATVHGPAPSDTWGVFAQAARSRVAELAEGRLLAPGGRDDLPKEPVRSGDRLVLPPPCEYCSHKTLCGVAFGEGQG